jgi:chemotaxis protein CheX
MDLGQAIIDGTEEVFTTMLMMELDTGTPIEGPGGDVASNITSMLGLGKDIKGMLAVHCPEIVAKDITGTFLGIEVEELDEDVKDAIGEIANMVAGSLKTYFQNHDKNIELAIPITVVGKSFHTAGMSGATRVAVPFSMNGTVFLVELKYVDTT